MDKQTENYLVQKVEQLEKVLYRLIRDHSETKDTALYCWNELDKLNYHLEVDHSNS